MCGILKNISDSWLVESMNTEPTDMEGQLYRWAMSMWQGAQRWSLGKCKSEFQQDTAASQS